MAPFAQVAPKAGAHHVLPRVRPAEVTRDNVVDGQLTRSRTAILAGVVIAHEDFASCHAHRNPRSPDVVPQPNDPRPGARPSRRPNCCSTGSEQLCLVGIDEGDSAAKATHVEWLKVNIQDEHPVDRVGTSPRA